MFTRQLTIVLMLGLSTIATAQPSPPFAGVDANYSLDLERDGQLWRVDDQPIDLFKTFANRGVQGFRVRLWTSNQGTNGREYASEIVRRALAAGLEPYLVIFLSDDWADLMKQPVPEIWKELNLDERCKAVRDYSQKTVEYFRGIGLTSHLYEIGNEIDYGICGIYPGKSTKKNPDSLSRRCWPDAVKIILASQQGVLAADPQAKFLLHISHWWDTDFCVSFFRYMVDHGVQLDYAGLSYFPSSNIGGSIELDQFEKTIDRLYQEIGKPIIIPETAYPSTSQFKGQFATWRKESPGYPLSPEGQLRWLSDFLDFCAHKEFIASVYYWSPEWSGETMWTAFALFDKDHRARPAWTAFSTQREARPPFKKPSYFEFRNGNLYAVPLQRARSQATEILKASFAKHGAVNSEYIQEISAKSLTVDGYDISLRSSLSGNIDLVNIENKALAVDMKKFFNSVNSNDRFVVFVDAPESELANELVRSAQASQIELVLHPMKKESVLKFGLDTNWQKDSN